MTNLETLKTSHTSQASQTQISIYYTSQILKHYTLQTHTTNLKNHTQMTQHNTSITYTDLKKLHISDLEKLITPNTHYKLETPHTQQILRH